MNLDDSRSRAEPTDPAWLARRWRPWPRDPAAIGRALPRRRGRRCGRGAALPPADCRGWTVDDAARVLLLPALPVRGRLATELEPLYRYGDAAEKRAVLRALPLLPTSDAAAAAPAGRHAHQRHPAGRRRARPVRRGLPDAAWRQAVLKCRLHRRARSTPSPTSTRAPTPNSARMLAGLVERTRRRPAGRADAAERRRPALLHRRPGEESR